MLCLTSFLQFPTIPLRLKFSDQPFLYSRQEDFCLTPKIEQWSKISTKLLLKFCIPTKLFFRFVGVDPKSDEVVLMKILAVLRTLMLSSVGLLLTNEGVCEILQSTFRICFETRLSDLLRKTAELALNDMIQLLFKRLPTFSEENLPLLKKLKMRNTGPNDGKSRRKRHEDGEMKKSRGNFLEFFLKAVQKSDKS